MFISGSTLLAALAAGATPAAAEEMKSCDKPVYMVVAGITHDRARMQAYGRAIAESKLYEKLGGYYLNAPLPIASFEGDVDPKYATQIVRFPCLANARKFWNSREYQENIKPLRLNPSAGDYNVTVYSDIPLRADMAGKVERNQYLESFDRKDIIQVEDKAP